MKKIFIVICSIILFSGCTVNYNITIKNNNDVIEDSIFTDENVNNKSDFDKKKKNIIDNYKEVLEKYNYKYDIINDNNTIKVKIYKKSNINTFLKNSLYNRIYSDNELIKYNGTISFRTIGTNFMNEIFVDEKNKDEYLVKEYIDTLRINITFENKVLSSNADEVNKDTNTYTWIFDRKNNNKSIEFKYSNERLQQLQENKTNKKPSELKTGLIGLLFIVIGAIILIVFMVLKSNKVNRL